MIQCGFEEGRIHTDKQSLSSLLPAQLAGLMEQLGQPEYRAKQIFGWLHQKRVADIEQMTNLPAALRQQLAQAAYVDRPREVRRLTSADGTVKLLLALRDGHCVETVLMRYKHGLSACISSQVGCRMGCAFCASGAHALGPSAGAAGASPTHGEGRSEGARLSCGSEATAAGGAGFVRNLTAGEIAGQVYAAVDAAGGERVNHLVMMGIGEPLDNFDNVAQFLQLIQHPEGYDMAGRNISLSTCGVVPGIRRLAALGHSLTLSLSLHAADDETRSRLMPVNRQWPLAQVMAACRDYQKQTGRRVSYEYALVRGENDSAADAEALAGLLAGSGGHLNLIAVNPVDGTGYTASDAEHIKGFAARMEQLRVRTTVRRRLGADIDAACGQLRIDAMATGGADDTQ